MQVVEIFKSIQGEGTLIGSPMVFIRLWGCNMNCTWCDTRYSWAPEFKSITKRDNLTPEALVKYLLDHFPEVTWFNFTGGEPTLWEEEIQQVNKLLQEQSKNTCIQTNGKEWKEQLFSSLDKVCMDIKCPTSGEISDLSSIGKLRKQDEIKLVLGSQEDVDYAKEIISSYQTDASIIIQPVLTSDEGLDAYYDQLKWLINEFSSMNTDKIRILPQLHQLLWRDQAGK